jgi:hypothetical protein
VQQFVERPRQSEPRRDWIATERAAVRNLNYSLCALARRVRSAALIRVW